MDESSISLEETNKIRESLGLPLIPVPDGSSESTNAKDKSPPVEEQGRRESISLEESNKIRASLGLAPIPVDSSTLSSTASQDEVAAQNWKQKYERESAIKAEEEKKRQEELADEKKKRNVRLEGKGLGDYDGQKTSTRSFLKNIRKNKPKISSIPDEEEPKEDYSAKDLSGLKVAHKLSDLQGLTQDTVLTLKDSSVLDEENEDELVAETLVDKENMEENRRNKKGLSKKYKSYDDDQFENDEENGDGFFVLDGSATIASASKKSGDLNKVTTGTVRDSIDFEDIGIGGTNGSSDYQEAKPVKFKKKKKASDKTKKRKRIKREEEEEEEKKDIKMLDYSEDEEEDDAQLQNMLSLSRRKAQKTSKKKKAEDLVDEILQENENKSNEKKPEEEGGMVIGGTDEFLATITHKVRTKQREDPQDEENTKMEPDAPTKAENESELPVNQNDDVNDAEENERKPVVAPSMDESMTISGGMGNALKLLQSRGVLKKKDETETEQDKRRKEQEHLVEKIRKERMRREVERQRKREEERLSGKFDGWTQKERERYNEEENRKWEAQYAEEMQRLFQNYRPEVNLSYNDEMGRELTTKEAYKHLSHQFHGRGPGKAKIEKKLQRMAEERELEAAPIFESSEDKKSTKGVRLQ